MRCFVVALLCYASAAHAESSPSSSSVYFSPRGGCTQAVVDELSRARHSVYVQAYSFTSVPIARALVAAAKRGVQVEVLLDKSNRTAKKSEERDIERAGVATAIDAAHAIAHNKVMVIDEETVLTGSFNFTTQAESRNAENLLVLRDQAMAGKYLENWRLHWAHSKPRVGTPSASASR